MVLEYTVPVENLFCVASLLGEPLQRLDYRRLLSTELILRSQSSAEANQSLIKLHAIVERILETNHSIVKANQILVESNQTIKIQLRELIARRSDPLGDSSDTASVVDGHYIPTSPDNSDTIHTGGAASFASSSSSTTDIASGNWSSRDQGDAASIMSTSSSFSMRSIRSVRAMVPSLQDALKNSRVYKRLHQRGGLDLDVSDSQSLSGVSMESREKGCSWSMLSDMSLGDLSLSDIAVMELPLYVTDLYDPRPYVLTAKPAGVHHRGSSTNLKLKWSSRGRIHNAISEGNIFVVRALLSIGSDIEERDRKGQTPLVHAVRREHETIVHLLLEKGANPEAQDAKGRTPLMLAVQRGHKAIVKFLLQKGVDLETQDAEGHTPLACAILKSDELAVKILVEQGAKTENLYLNDADLRRDLKSGLHNATAAGNLKVVSLLLALGADMEERDIQGLTPVAHAVLENREDIVKFLLENGANVDILSDTGSKRDLKGRIHDAIEAGNVAVVRMLLAMGVDTEERDTHGLTAVALAVVRNHKVIVELLLQKGVNLETPDAEGLTPLAHAVLENNEHFVKLLLKKEANIDVLNGIGSKRDLKGRIHSAIRVGNSNVVRLLLVMGVDVEEGNEEGLTPLAHAVLKINEHFVKLFLEKGANIDILSDIGSKRDLKGRIHSAIDNGNSNVVRLLLVMGVDVDERGWNKMTPLLNACRHGNSEIAKMLVAQGADVKACDDRGQTVLHRTVESKDASLLTFLLDNGALELIDATDNDGDTPLHIAGMWDRRLPVAQILVERGARLDKKNKKGRTPYEYALSLSHTK
jgi:ankyrin repeat protein